MAVSATSLETAELHLRAADAALRVSACAARTDRGVSRALNEDAVLVAGPLLAVADGVGGHSAGEEASAIAVDALRRHVGVFGDDPGAELARALRCANADVRAAARAPGRAGMATTMVAALVAGASVTVAHVGDSRAYLSHEGRLQRLTVDHSLVAALMASGAVDAVAVRTHPQRAVIVRAIGLDDQVSPEIATAAAHRGDLLLLCSDGLSDAVDEAEIERTTAAVTDLDRLVTSLAAMARESGATDDVSIIAARLG